MDRRPHSRRQFTKFLGAAALAAIPAATLLREASAGRTWCRVDPLFSIDGYLFDIAISADEAMLSAATGPVKITLHVPIKSNAVLLFEDTGFGYGYEYTIIKDRKQNSQSSFSVGVDVLAPASDSSLPVSIRLSSVHKDAEVIAAEEVFGSANTTISWYGKVAKVQSAQSEALLTGQ